MTRTRVVIAGGVLLGLSAVALTGVSLARVRSAGAQAAAPATWTFPLPPVSGPGFASLDGVRPGGAWPAMPSRLRGPEQPILYRHDIHAGQYAIPCLYCHNNAANSWTAMLPSISTCMGCHTLIQAPDSTGAPNAEIAKLAEHATRGESVPWLRVNKISEHAHFPHMRHVNAGLTCQECHGNVQQMPRVFAVRDVNQMGWCTDCHMRRGITRDCTACHF